MSRVKWRGISTTQKKINEDVPKTIINRFHQKSMSLPRIDDKKRWAGYPGITGVSKRIAKLIPDCEYYVEPFAGAAKVFQELMKRRKISIKHTVLNEKAKYVYQWLKTEFPIYNVEITRMDFSSCIKKYDSKETVFLIDGPWFPGSYDQNFSCFDRPSVKAYDEEVLKLCQKMTGKFLITSRKENKIMLESGWNHKLIKSGYVVCGKYPRVLITTNLDLRYRNY